MLEVVMPPVCGSIGETGGLPVVILTYCMSLVSGNKTIMRLRGEEVISSVRSVYYGSFCVGREASEKMLYLMLDRKEKEWRDEIDKIERRVEERVRHHCDSVNDRFARVQRELFEKLDARYTNLEQECSKQIEASVVGLKSMTRSALITFQDRVQGKIQDLQRSLENQLSSVFENNSDEQYREIIGTILKVKSWTTQAHQQIVWLKRMVVFLAVLGIINTAVALLF